MQQPDPVQWMSLLSNPTFLFLVFWFLREMYALSKSKVSDINVKLSELTIAIVKLETRLESIQRLTDAVPKLIQDNAAFHEKVREMNQ